MLKKSNYVITKADSGNDIKVYNGKEIFLIKVLDNMEGHCIGEYILTKKVGSMIHRKKKKEKK